MHLVVTEDDFWYFCAGYFVLRRVSQSTKFKVQSSVLDLWVLVVRRANAPCKCSLRLMLRERVEINSRACSGLNWRMVTWIQGPRSSPPGWRWAPSRIWTRSTNGFVRAPSTGAFREWRWLIATCSASPSINFFMRQLPVP